MANRIRLMMLCCMLILMYSCDKLLEDEPFSLKKGDYNGYEIKTAGYFYKYMNEIDSYSIIVFYRNGIVYNQFSVDSLEAFENQIQSGNYTSDYKWSWGLFTVDPTGLRVENLLGMGGLHFIAYTDYGNIINDSTIHFYKHKESWSDVSEAIDDTFHFKVFSPKPDSINNYLP